MAGVRIFVVPGISASQLEDQPGGLGVVWIDPAGLTLNNEFAALARRSGDDGDAVAGVHLEAKAVLPILFDALVEALRFSFDADVETFPFDWRSGIPANGRRLAARLGAVLGRDRTTKVALVAHSMGGLVLADACTRLTSSELDRIAGNVTMGTPWLGAYEAVRALALAGVVPQPFAPILKHDVDTVRSVFQTFRGLAHLLPAGDPRVVNPALYAPGPLARDAGLQRGLADVATLVRTPPPRTVAIVSDSYQTRDGMTRTPSGGDLDWQFAPGDGIVSLRSATARGTIPVERVDATHSLMPLYPSVIRRTIRALSPLIGAPRSFASVLFDRLAALGDWARVPSTAAASHLAVLTRMPLTY